MASVSRAAEMVKGCGRVWKDGPSCANDEDSPMGGGWVNMCGPLFLHGARLRLVCSGGSCLLRKWTSLVLYGIAVGWRQRGQVAKADNLVTHGAQ